MNEIKVAVLGMGFIGKVHTYACAALPFYYNELPFKVKLSGIYDRTLAKVQAAKNSFGFEFATDCADDILLRGDADAVCICVPNYQHSEFVLKAIERGRHIYCEKPLAASAEEADAIVDALKGKHIINRIVFHSRFFTSAMRARQIIVEGRLGRILGFHVLYQHSSNLDATKKYNWKFSKAYACGGALIDMGSHMLDMIYYLIGEYKGLFMKAQIVHETRPDESNQPRVVDVEDAAYIVAQMKNGAMGTMQVSKIAAGSNDEFIIEITGEKGAIKLDLMDPNWVWFYDNTVPDADLGGCKGFTKIESVQRYAPPGGSFPSPKLAGGWLRAHVHSLYEFLNGVHCGAPCRPDIADGAYIQRVMQAAYESERKSEWIQI